MAPRPVPRGECRQCWQHAHVLHKGNLLGLKREDDCQACLNHMNNGCPPDQIQQ